ncbi:amino acid ABC transporter permease [Opitutaceae bacterium]|jgi:polar amino acid transport system permease protein|nr:amino acid ABC transporter permease [Opitutaceae bacterium]
MSESFAFLSDMVDYGPQILNGLINTLLLSGTISVTGLVAGILIFRLTLSESRVIRRSTASYISFFIGTPLIVLLFLMYYGLPQWSIKLSPFAIATIGFTLNVAAYNSRYLSAAYNGVDQQQLMAASAQGFSSQQIFTLIILPQTLRRAIPGLTNQVALNIKDSSIAFLIQYVDFFAQMQEQASLNFQYLKIYAVTGAVYLLLVSIVIFGSKRLETRFAIPH